MHKFESYPAFLQVSQNAKRLLEIGCHRYFAKWLVMAILYSEDLAKDQRISIVGLSAISTPTIGGNLFINSLKSVIVFWQD